MLTTASPPVSDVTLGDGVCGCSHGVTQAPTLVAITGGPGAGKTAILQLARKVFCHHVAVVPEAATMLFAGGFWRRETDLGRKAAQEAIFHVQRALEAMLIKERLATVGLCDRGTPDSVAYWPGPPEDFWQATGTTRTEELARYAAVIHLRTPTTGAGYNHQNPERTESARQAAERDQAILAAWKDHPNRLVIEASADFTLKTWRTLAAIATLIPACCRTHDLAGKGEPPRF